MRVTARHTRTLLLSVAAALLASPATGQRVDPNRVFDLTLQVDEQVMSATVREGGAFNLTLRRTDEYRLVPVANRGGVTMAVYRGTAGQPSTIRIVERVQLAVGRPVTLRTNPAFTLVVDQIRSAPPQAQGIAQPRAISFTLAASWRRVAQDGNCCVCCGDACACACGVKVACGSCCMPGCCGIIQPTANPAPEDREQIQSARLATYLGGSACDRPFGVAAPIRTRIAAR
jgi:hypothetical protein